MYKNYFKRILDIILVVIFLFLLSWVIAIIWIVYLCQLQLPVLFKQDRVGMKNSRFTIYKFRTLSNAVYLNNQQRRFWWGDVLRSLSLDEIPQLWNVLRGDMSFIGPRPLLVEYLPLFTEEQKRRHEVRPGITGWAQINGRSSIPWSEKFKLDLFYVDNLSFKLDAIIVLQTLLVWFSFRKDVSLNEEKFGGPEGNER